MFSFEIFNEAFAIMALEAEVRQRADPAELEGFIARLHRLGVDILSHIPEGQRPTPPPPREELVAQERELIGMLAALMGRKDAAEQQEQQAQLERLCQQAALLNQLQQEVDHVNLLFALMQELLMGSALGRADRLLQTMADTNPDILRRAGATQEQLERYGAVPPKPDAN